MQYKAATGSVDCPVYCGTWQAERTQAVVKRKAHAYHAQLSGFKDPGIKEDYP